MEDTKEILNIIFSWPLVVIVIIFTFKNSIKNIINRFIESDSSKAKIGNFEIELGKISKINSKILNSVDNLNYLIANIKLLELDVMQNQQTSNMSELEQSKLYYFRRDLKKLLTDIEKHNKTLEEKQG